MKIEVLYFARMREAMGRERETVEPGGEVRTLGELRAWLAGRGGPSEFAFASVRPLRAAIDRQLAKDEALLRDGAEVAFFPPVTGG
jgi:molybdopterin synthase sulfur carrier subunit